MRLITAHIRITLLGLLRSPGYWVPTLLFPTMLYLFFGARVVAPDAAAVALAAWSVYAVLGVAFYQFGVGVAQDRECPWDTYLRILPAGSLPPLLAQIVVAILFAIVAVLILWAAAGQAAGIDLGIGARFRLGLVLALGAIPFALFGIALGYLVSAKAAVPVANMLFLPLAFAGGLWLPPSQLPEAVARISPLLPTRHFGELAWAAVTRGALPVGSALWLAGYTLVFAMLAVWARRRDQGRRYT